MLLFYSENVTIIGIAKNDFCVQYRQQVKRLKEEWK